MIPDVTPNGVFYLPPTGWLTSFYNLPKLSTARGSTLLKNLKIKKHQPKLMLFGIEAVIEY
jgi:hypothetical protein